MKEIHITETRQTPQVEFNSEGSLLLKGRSLITNAVTFYEPLIEWALQIKNKSVRFTLEMDYLNTSSAKNLLELLLALESNEAVEHLEVIWKYEEDDEDTLEKGHIFEEKLKKAVFSFVELIDA